MLAQRLCRQLPVISPGHHGRREIQQRCAATTGPAHVSMGDGVTGSRTPGDSITPPASDGNQLSGRPGRPGPPRSRTRAPCRSKTAGQRVGPSGAKAETGPLAPDRAMAILPPTRRAPRYAGADQQRPIGLVIRRRRSCRPTPASSPVRGSARQLRSLTSWTSVHRERPRDGCPICCPWASTMAGNVKAPGSASAVTWGFS